MPFATTVATKEILLLILSYNSSKTSCPCLSFHVFPLRPSPWLLYNSLNTLLFSDYTFALQSWRTNTWYMRKFSKYFFSLVFASSVPPSWLYIRCPIVRFRLFIAPKCVKSQGQLIFHTINSPNTSLALSSVPPLAPPSWLYIWCETRSPSRVYNQLSSATAKDKYEYK